MTLTLRDLIVFTSEAVYTGDRQGATRYGVELERRIVRLESLAEARDGMILPSEIGKALKGNFDA